MSRVVLGFSGTLTGMTPKQIDRLWERLRMINPLRVVHGCCIGADKEFDKMAVTLGVFRYLYPSDLANQSAIETILEWSNKVPYYLNAPENPLKRNRKIVESSTRIIIAPKEMCEIIRSGTWMTYRYACERHVPVTILWPDGTMTVRA